MATGIGLIDGLMEQDGSFLFLLGPPQGNMLYFGGVLLLVRQ